jgi:hypothetical protein
MSGSTINSKHLEGVTLGVGGYTSPLTITPVMFSGGPPNPPTITGGFVAAETAGTAGVFANYAGASILNQGVIYGAQSSTAYPSVGGDGVDLFGGGTLTNMGNIGGGFGSNGAMAGVNVSGGWVFNTGGIRGGYHGGTGLVATNAYVLNGGTTAEIQGGFEGMSTSSVGAVLTGGTLINDGNISPGYHGGSGARLYGGASLTNNGVVEGGAYGAFAVYAKDGTVLNDATGRIQPSETSGQGIDLLSGSTLINQGLVGLPSNYISVGTSGGVGVYLAAGAVLINTGQIEGIGAGSTQVAGTGVVVVNNSFTNDGTITGGTGNGEGFEAPGYGTLAGHGGVGVYLHGGSVTNAGLISGGEAKGASTYAAQGGVGVLVNGGTLTNAATITGGPGGYKTALGGLGVVVLAGSVINNSAIYGGESNATIGAGASLAGGSLTNTMTIAGSDGVDVGAEAAGENVYVGNSGAISGLLADGVSLATAARVVNSGSIGGAATGVYFGAGGGAGGSLTNQAGGRISGGTIGVSLDDASLTNALGGTIVAATLYPAGGGYVVTASSGTVLNLGALLGEHDATGVRLNGGSVVNGSATDTAARIVAGSDGAGAALTGGSLSNFGTISGGGGYTGAGSGKNAGVALIGASASNQGAVVGGYGAGGHYVVESGTGQTGYTGAAGVVLTDSTLANGGTITGGVGGMGGGGFYGSSQPGAGGQGGVGMLLISGYLGSTGLIIGGAGGPGGTQGINPGVGPTGDGGGGARVDGGSMTNSGTVSGAAVPGGTGVYGLYLAAGAVTNHGTIQGSSGASYVIGGTGVTVTGGALDNTGLIAGGNGAGGFYNESGGTGLYLTGATATTSGTIAGGAIGLGQLNRFGAAGDAVLFGSVAATLIIDPGASFNGQVVANGAVVDVLDLASAASTGTLSGLGSEYNGFVQVTIDRDATWQFTGTDSLAAGATITNSGTLIDDGALINNGVIVLDPSTMNVGSLFGTGSVTVGADSLLEVTGSIASGQTIMFAGMSAGSGAYLHLDSPTNADGSVSNFDWGETIDLKGVDTGSVNYANGQLTFSAGGTGGSFPLAIVQGQTLHIASSTDGTELTLQCYRRGTRILTERGERAVEALQVGDRIRTMLDGSLAPIIWLGRREVDCASRPQPRKVWPVRVAAGAFGPGRPHSDLWLSPDHAVYVDGVLIPVRYLINGCTIMQVPAQRVTYYHVELPQHDVVLAEGLPAESFLDMRDGSNYANRPGPIRLYPDFPARMWEAFGCARLVVTGPELDAARALVARFATHQAAA